jgi:predicted DNA-binding antitoxin AbrB/MazE fold protein
MKSIHAIFENGVFRPTEPVDLPEGTAVVIEACVAPHDEVQAAHLRIFEILSHSYNTEDLHAADSHDEHQP